MTHRRERQLFGFYQMVAWGRVASSRDAAKSGSSSSGSRLLASGRPLTLPGPASQQSPPRPVPADHGFWTHDDQTRAPVAPPRQPRQAKPRRRIDASRLHPSLLVEGELAAQDQILRFARPPGSNRKQCQADEIGQQEKNNPSEGDHARIMPRRRAGSTLQI